MFFSYSLRRGVLVVSLYDKKTERFGKFKEIIREDYHLSYPFIFQGGDDEIYILPESNECQQLYLYKASAFPDKWEKHKVLQDNVKMVDTTPFLFQDKPYAFSLELSDVEDEQFVLLEIDPYDYTIGEQRRFRADMSTDRPGGRVFQLNGEYYFVSQDCQESYGKALNIFKFQIKENGIVDRLLVKKICPDNISGYNFQTPFGIHTYNFCNNIEVIDLKYYKKSYYRIIKRMLSRK